MPKFCENCGTPLGDAKRFCSQCGAPIPEPRAAQGDTPFPPAAQAPSSARDGTDLESPYAPPKEEKTCVRCGSVLPDDALYCEQCSQSVYPQSISQTWLRHETIRDIERRYSPLWLILNVFLAVALFGLPESMLKTGMPALFRAPAAWIAAFVALCALVWLDFFLERRAALKKLGIDPEKHGLFGIRSMRTVARRRSAEFRFNVLFALFAMLALFGLSLFCPGQKGGFVPDAVAAARNTPGPSVSGTPIPDGRTPAPADTALTLDGVWLPVEETTDGNTGGGSVDGVPVPNMVDVNPGVLFRDGRMFMGIGGDAEEIYEYSCNDHAAIPGYAGYPFTLVEGTITISDPYTSTPDQVWTIDDQLVIYIGGAAAFAPSGGARVVD
ncbi:MAG TPA: zinc-ribbon domain-containing protein [Clostridia bacterium]|nr:zinc-ribbon domain-containing protein [Clostridia bacterium]